MTMQSILRTIGLALLCAVVVGVYDRHLGFVLFFGISATMLTGDFIELRRRKRLVALLSRSEENLAQAIQVLETSLAQARALSDDQLVRKASSALASTQELLSNVRAMRASMQ